MELRRNDVEMPVEVDDPGAAADAATHDARIRKPAGRRELDQLGRGAQPRHRVEQDPSATAEPAAGRILGVDGHELLQQRGHLVGARLEPGLHLSGAIHYLLPSHRHRSNRNHCRTSR